MARLKVRALSHGQSMDMIMRQPGEVFEIEETTPVLRNGKPVLDADGKPLLHTWFAKEWMEKVHEPAAEAPKQPEAPKEPKQPEAPQP